MSNVYKTNSLPLASFLYANRGKLTFEGIDKTDLSKIYFIFAPAEDAQELATQYFTGKASADPSELFKNYRVLKDMVFENKRNI